MNAGTEGTIDTKRLIFPALGGFYPRNATHSHAIIRCCAGAIVIYHGYMKLFAGFAGPVAQNVLTPLGFPRPLAWAYFLGVLEFFGGAALAVGFLTRPLALMFTVQMAIVTYWHAGNGYFFSSPRGGWEFPLLLTFLYGATFFRGAAVLALDRMIGKGFRNRRRRRKRWPGALLTCAVAVAGGECNFGGSAAGRLRQGGAATLRPATPCQQS